MNEQIKALMGQTLDEKFAGTWSTMDMQDLQKFAERFAELIVRESADFVSGAAEVYNQAEQDACVRASIGLKKYFGVEE